MITKNILREQGDAKKEIKGTNPFNDNTIIEKLYKEIIESDIVTQILDKLMNESFVYRKGLSYLFEKNDLINEENNKNLTISINNVFKELFGKLLSSDTLTSVEDEKQKENYVGYLCEKICLSLLEEKDELLDNGIRLEGSLDRKYKLPSDSNKLYSTHAINQAKSALNKLIGKTLDSELSKEEIQEIEQNLATEGTEDQYILETPLDYGNYLQNFKTKFEDTKLFEVSDNDADKIKKLLARRKLLECIKSKKNPNEIKEQIVKNIEEQIDKDLQSAIEDIVISQYINYDEQIKQELQIARKEKRKTLPREEKGFSDKTIKRLTVGTAAAGIVGTIGLASGVGAAIVAGSFLSLWGAKFVNDNMTAYTATQNSLRPAAEIEIINPRVDRLEFVKQDKKVQKDILKLKNSIKSIAARVKKLIEDNYVITNKLSDILNENKKLIKEEQLIELNYVDINKILNSEKLCSFFFAPKDEEAQRELTLSVCDLLHTYFNVSVKSKYEYQNKLTHLSINNAIDNTAQKGQPANENVQELTQGAGIPNDNKSPLNFEQIISLMNLMGGDLKTLLAEIVSNQDKSQQFFQKINNKQINLENLATELKSIVGEKIKDLDELINDIITQAQTDKPAISKKNVKKIHEILFNNKDALRDKLNNIKTDSNENFINSIKEKFKITDKKIKIDKDNYQYYYNALFKENFIEDQKSYIGDVVIFYLLKNQLINFNKIKTIKALIKSKDISDSEILELEQAAEAAAEAAAAEAAAAEAAAEAAAAEAAAEAAYILDIAKTYQFLFSLKFNREESSIKVGNIINESSLVDLLYRGKINDMNIDEYKVSGVSEKNKLRKEWLSIWNIAK